MTTLQAAVAAAVPGLVSELYGARFEDPEYLRDAIESVDRDELIATLAGTDEKGSTAYKSQRRNIERYLAGAGKQTRSPRGRLIAVVSALADLGGDVEITNAVVIEFEGAVVVSPGGKSPDERQRDFTVTIDPDSFAAVVHALADGNTEDAADELESAMLEEYGIGHSAAITDVDHLGLSWE